ncbi:hypothetical protein NQ176_g2856 [Zarea fungicola]|uniref:Uncharacterized protein n=1 Tax=Zarea fungicola TaxID=93591 RepID=A0ACC1NME7_9HYPO|nr:hypothetical protein NQ176_g2856 [Lecanicillium fungicola]
MDATIKAPYFAPECQLPAPLPTPEQIAASADVLLETDYHCRVVRVGDYVVKYGQLVKLTEAETMLFLKQVQKDIPVPQIYAFYSTVENGKTVKYIIMEYIPGQSLDKCWPNLQPGEKLRIAQQLRTHLDLLRSIPAPEYFGCVGRKPYNNGFLWPETIGQSEEDKNTSGPFESEAELTESLVKSTIRHMGDDEYRISFFRRVLSDVLRNNRAVFTHGDLQKKNIMMRQDGSVVLIDWEYSGWCPEYMEYTSAMVLCRQFDDDYNDHLAMALDSYNAELGWMEMIIKTVRFG